jgi:hypothetical protein
VTPISPTTPNPRRRRLQFSLRAMLESVLVVGAGFGCLAGVVQQSRASREAVMTTSVTHVQVLEIRHLFLEVFGTAHGDRRNARAKVLQLAKAGELAESCVRDLRSI